MSSQPRYIAIAQRKQAELAAAIPPEWRLPAHAIPEGMLSVAESITEGPKKYERVGVMGIPRTCGLLSAKELDITENYGIRGLVAEMSEGRFKVEDVVRGFCKVCHLQSPGFPPSANDYDREQPSLISSPAVLRSPSLTVH